MHKSNNKIILSRDVTFLESDMSPNEIPSLTPTLVKETTSQDDLLLDSGLLKDIPTIKQGSLTPPSQELNPVLEHIQEPIASEIPMTTSFNDNATEDSVNSTSLPLNSQQKKSQFNGGLPQSQLLRKSQRVIIKPKRLIETIEGRHHLGHPNYHHKAMMSQVSILTEPTTFKEALSRPDASKWQDAINEELNSLTKNKTWEYVSLPPNRKAIGNRWIF